MPARTRACSHTRVPPGGEQDRLRCHVHLAAHRHPHRTPPSSSTIRSLPGTCVCQQSGRMSSPPVRGDLASMRPEADAAGQQGYFRSPDPQGSAQRAVQPATVLPWQAQPRGTDHSPAPPDAHTGVRVHGGPRCSSPVSAHDCAAPKGQAVLYVMWGTQW